MAPSDGLTAKPEPAVARPGSGHENAAHAPTAIELKREAASSALQLHLPRGVHFVAAILTGIWGIGTVLLLIRLVYSWQHLRRILRSAAPSTDSNLSEIFARVNRDFSLRTVPELLMSDKVSGPISAGWVRPKIVLPARLVAQISTAELRDILIHEAAHVLRRDQVTVLLQNMVGAIHWFHPFVTRFNRELSQAREEICDNHVLRTSSAPDYSRTLLALAELVTVRPVPGAVGLFSSHWKLESRVGGLLDARRNRAVEVRYRAKLLIAATSVAIAVVTTLGTVSIPSGQNQAVAAAAESNAQEKGQRNTEASTQQDSTTPANKTETASPRGPTMRGEGTNRQMLLRGRVFAADGRPAGGFDLAASVYKSELGRDNLPTSVKGNEFEIWIPIGGSHWRHIELAATANNGTGRATLGIGGHELRQAAIDGVELRLAPLDRTVTVIVMDQGKAVANAHVNAQLADNALLQSQADATGVATFKLRAGEKLDQITAWTDDFRIGGHSFSRKPRWDPLGEKFSIELDDCHDQKIRFLNAEDNSPVRNVQFELTVGTGQPNYNFAAVPSNFPQCRMQTNKNGEAVFRWFPNWKTHGAYVEIIDAGWATATEGSDLKAAEDGALLMTLKRRVARKPLVGKVASDHLNVGGLLVEIKSFQGEEKDKSDFVYAVTDPAGNFAAECIPGARYAICVNDRRLASKFIDLIPYEPDTGKSNEARLEVHEGRAVEIRVTSGPRHRPIPNQWVYVRENHSYDWVENGKQQSGQGARDFPTYTDAQGVARTQALPGAELRITVYADDWRSEDQKVIVKDNGVNLVKIHRSIDAVREIKGRLLPPPGVDAALAGAEIIFGSIDGETDEREAIVADPQGNFAFKSKAIQLGIFAYTKDGKAAGILRPDNVSAPLEIQLKPTMDLQGRLLGANDKPLANHGVRVTPRVSGKFDHNKSFSSSFETKTFETRTDANGNYTLKNLPTELHMTLRADPIDGSKYDSSLDEVYLTVGDQRPRMISQLGDASEPDDELTFSEEYDQLLRDARLGDFHLLVLSYDASANDFVNQKLLDRKDREVMSYLNLSIQKYSAATAPSRELVKSKNWPQPVPGKLFACALDATGKELGRIVVDISEADAGAAAVSFIRQHAPPQADAQAKWAAAFAEAKRSGRRVWARVSERYCGPCFRLSRWIDHHHELLERDYVLLKIDDARDLHGTEIAKRIDSNREQHGIPFYTIFDADERPLTNSESPIGNIGHPSSFEGRRHLTKMLYDTHQKLTKAEIDQIVGTLGKSAE